MNKGDKRRKKRRYRIRYDRIIIFVLLIASVGVLGSTAVKALLGTGNPDVVEDSDTPPLPEPTAAEVIPEPTEAIPAPTEAVTEFTITAPTEAATEESTQSAALPGDMTEVSLENSGIYKGNLIVVNADYEYKFPEDDLTLLTVYDNMSGTYGAGDMVTELDFETLTHLNSLIDAYSESLGGAYTGIFVQDGFRTYNEQADRHSSGRSKTFEAGHTDYHTGRTIDFFRMDEYSATGYSYFSADEQFRELTGKYGFILRYPEGKQAFTGENPREYTYRYVGVPHAEYINANSLCLEEYISRLKTHTVNDPLEIYASDGGIYKVYYTEQQSGELTTAAVPSSTGYSVSGDNGSGFIITYKVN